MIFSAQFEKGRKYYIVLQDIIKDSTGFMKSRVIITAGDLDIFTRLQITPNVTADELADLLCVNERALDRLLDCLVTFGLVEKCRGRFNITETGAYFSSRHPQSVLPFLKHASHLWLTWSNLTEAVKNGFSPGMKTGTRTFSDEDTKAFIGAMHVVAANLSRKIAGSYGLGRFKRLLDIGGGSGAYTIAFLSENAGMRAVIFDLERVVPIARDKITEAHLLERVDFVSGDFNTDELPRGCDLALLSAIIHQNSPQQNLGLFHKVNRSLEPGGALLIRDFVMEESRTEPQGGALFALNMLVGTPGGDTYTFEEIKGSLKKAGFTKVRMVSRGEGRMDALVEALKQK